MTERPILFSAPMVRALLAGRKTQTRRLVDPARHTEDSARCPYGKPRDRLWVRETWATDADFDSVKPCHIDSTEAVFYVADGAHRGPVVICGRTRVSIHMPRWASRITLEITEVRVQRIQDISEDDALAEGVEATATATPRDAFSVLWHEINGERAPWTSNPWLWAISFRRVTP